MRGILTAIMIALVLIGAVLALVSCAADDNAAARRAQEEAAAARAEADRTRAEAEAYQQRQQADTAAAAERAAIRQAEANAAQARAISWLPYVLIVAGLIVFAGLLLAMGYLSIRRQQAPAVPMLPGGYWPAPALPAPPTINVFVLPSTAGRGRAEYWRQLETVAGQASRGPVTIDDRR